MTINLKILLCVLIIIVFSETIQITAKPHRHPNHNDGNHQHNEQSLIRCSEHDHAHYHSTNRHRHHGHKHSEEWHRRHNHGHHGCHHHDFHRTTPSPVETSSYRTEHSIEWQSKYQTTLSPVENSIKSNPEWKLDSQSPANGNEFSSEEFLTSFQTKQQKSSEKLKLASL
jgi:hypothetical protein